MEPHFEKLQGTLKSTSLELRWSFPALVGVLGYLYIPNTPVSYLKYSIDLLAPHPFGMWVAHGLAVHECLLPLVFIFTSLVASDVRDSYKRKQELCLQAARWRGNYFKLWESARQISDKFPRSYHLSHIEPNLKKENRFPPLSNQHLSWTSASISLRLGSPGKQWSKGEISMLDQKPTELRWPRCSSGQEQEEHHLHRSGGPCGSVGTFSFEAELPGTLVTTCPLCQGSVLILFLTQSSKSCIEPLFLATRL